MFNLTWLCSTGLYTSATIIRRAIQGTAYAEKQRSRLREASVFCIGSVEVFTVFLNCADSAKRTTKGLPCGVETGVAVNTWAVAETYPPLGLIENSR